MSKIIVTALSTLPPVECGIANYADRIYSELEKCSDIHLNRIPIPEIPKCSAHLPRIAELIPSIFSTRTDVLHIQHEFGLFGPSRGVAFLKLLRDLGKKGLRIVITLHTAHEQLDADQREILRRIADEEHWLIVHDQVQADRVNKLSSHGHAAPRISVIPHGIEDAEALFSGRDANECATESCNILMAGYIRPRKGFHRIVDLFPRILELCPSACLTIASGLRREGEFADYQAVLLEKVARSPVVERIKLRSFVQSRAEMRKLFNSAKVVVLPYEMGGQSGIASDAFGARCPIVVSALDSFKNLIQRSGGGAIAHSDEEFATQICEICTDNSIRRRMVEAIQEYARSDSGWSRVASQHVRLYCNVVASRIRTGHKR